MNISSTEKGQATVALIKAWKQKLAVEMRQKLADKFREEAFQYKSGLEYLRSTDLKIPNGTFQSLWQELQNYGVLISKGCPPGFWRFDRIVYETRYRQSLAAPDPPPSPAPTSTPLPTRRETAYEVRKNLPGLLETLPPELVLMGLLSLMGKKPPTRNQMTALRRLLKGRLAGLSATERDSVLKEALAATLGRFLPPAD